MSLPEPENQARPATLEQLLVLLTRESARRIVHLVNGATSLAAKTPRWIGKLLIRISRRLLTLTDATLKVESPNLRSEFDRFRKWFEVDLSSLFFPFFIVDYGLYRIKYYITYAMHNNYNIEQNFEATIYNMDYDSDLC